MKWINPRTACLTALLLGLLSLSSMEAAEKKLKVTSTTSMVTDLVKNIGGTHVEAQGLMGPGVDPHLYKATARDTLKLQSADIVFYSGLLLEGKMQDLFTQMKSKKKHVYAVTDPLTKAQLLTMAPSGHPDPHVWFDVQLWSKCIAAVRDGLTAADPAHKADFAKNAEAYEKQLEQVHSWALQKVSELPKEKRILVTSHDAFNYFGRAYAFEVIGLQGVSTVTEAGLADMAKLVDLVKAKHIKAVFIESSVPPAAIKRISQDAGVKIGGELFSDAMGTPGEIENGYDLGTYEGMIKHNINTIVAALK
jgi:manganese/zinc/iron transport system substrate-binding protein